MKEKLKTISIIHLGLCAGLIFAYYFIGKDYFKEASFNDVSGMDYLYLFLPLIAYYLSQFLYQNQLKNLSSSQSEDEKFMIFQTASIMRWAIIEGCAFAILFIAPQFIYLGVLLIVYLVIIRPTESQINTVLNSRN